MLLSCDCSSTTTALGRPGGLHTEAWKLHAALAHRAITWRDITHVLLPLVIPQMQTVIPSHIWGVHESLDGKHSTEKRLQELMC